MWNASSRSEVIKVIFEGLDELVELFEKISDDKSKTNGTRTDTEILLQNVQLQFHIFLWAVISQKIKRVHKLLHDPIMNFKYARLDMEHHKINVRKV
jgi:hypothetical protein